MELFIFARFHALPGNAVALAKAIAEVIAPTRREPGCLSIDAFRSTQDTDLFWIHSRWADELSFDTHAGLEHTVAFLAAAALLIDHPLDVSRTRPLQR
jgi:quinol monooxygenase YgiN